MVCVRVVAGDGDWPAWRDARVAALTDAPHAFTSRLEDWARGGEDAWRERYTTAGAHNLVASLDGRTVGMARGVPEGCGVAVLHSVWVAPDARGRGVGDRLVAAIEAWARHTGARTLLLAVFAGNDGAIALYRRHGFTPDGEVLRDGTSRELVMAKPLE